MTQAKIPTPVNEPVLSYVPGNRERVELKQALKDLSGRQIEIPVVFEHKQRVVTGEGERFNRAVADCDTNKDGAISEVEARIFANRHH